MKLIRTFSITSQEFYDYLENQLLEDIQKTTNKRISKKDIRKGFSYEKKVARSKITINDYQRDKLYSVTVQSNTDYMTVSYMTNETKEGLEIVFEQFISGYDDVRNKKNFLSRTLHDWICFGRMSNTLYGIRNEIQNIREGIVTKPMKQNEPFKKLRKTLEKKLEEESTS